MMRSMYSAVSGLRIHQSKMDTIGNNIANVNTVGFKRGQVTFQEVFSQTVRGASAPAGGKGGTNPQQVGMGAAMGSISTVHTRGPGQRTDNATDLMIDGEGFFVVSDDTNFGNRYYTRAGNFTTDRDGNLVTQDGLMVLGYAADGEGNITSDIRNIRINMSETEKPVATEKIEFRGNLDSRFPDGRKKDIDTVIYDTLGNSYSLTFEVMKNEKTSPTDPDTWDISLKRVTNRANGNYKDKYTYDVDGTIASSNGLDGYLSNNPLQIEFDKDGNMTRIDTEILDGSTGFKFGISGLSGIIFDTDKENKTIPTDKQVGPSGNFENITIFDSEDEDSTKNIHQYANEFDFKPYMLNGNTSGTIEGFSIDDKGNVVGSFTNGEKRVLGQILLAKFDNPMGLEKLGGNLFVDSRNSGEPQYGGAALGGFGAISPGNLEMSNVDISMEFTEMITTQRGFQANSRIITTSDEMLQELVNMKR